MEDTKWACRYWAETPAGMMDRSSRPHHQPSRARHLRRWWAGSCTCDEGPARPVEIGNRLEMSSSTVDAVLVRHPINRLSLIDRVTGEPIRRYEAPTPGDLIHVDVIKHGNVPDGGGWRYLGKQRGQRNSRAPANCTAGAHPS